MDAFTLEVVRPGEGSTSRTISVTSELEIWRHVERVARHVPKPDGVHIRVRDGNGNVVVLTGVRTALLVSQERNAAA